MVDRFLKILRDSCGVRPGMSVLVCCSGGIDSMVLLDLMRRAAAALNLRIGVVHVDHGLRGEESSSDARFVAGQCEEMRIESFVYALGMDPAGANLEEEARTRRYDAIMRCRKEHGFDAAVTGHTMDDQAETLVYRFIRGSGIRGLAGMDYASPDDLLRPLLGFSRAEIEAYAEQGSIQYVEDSTNDDTRLARNLIRHEILPLMKKINPLVVQSVSRLSEIAREEGGALAGMADALERRALVVDWNLVRAYRASDLRDAHEAVAKRMIINVLSEMLHEPRGVDAIQIRSVMEVLQGTRRGHTVKRLVKSQLDGEALVFSTAGKGPFYDVPVEAPGVCRIEAIGQTMRIESAGGMSLPLRTRSYLPGDRIGTKRVVKLLSDRSVMKSLRVFWPVVLRGDEIVCVAGIASPEMETGIETEFPAHG